MAYTAGPFLLVVDLLDNGGRTFRRAIPMRSTIVTMAAAEAAANDFLLAHTGVSALTIPRYTIQRRLADSLVGAPASPLALFDQMAFIALKDAVIPTKRHYFNIEGPKDEIFPAGSAGSRNYDAIDVDDPALATFFAQYNSNSDAVVLSDNEQVTNVGNPIIEGKRVHK